MAQETGTKTIPLSKPLTVGETKVTQLEMKEPNAGHFMQHGMPFSSTGDVDFAKAMNIIEATTGVQLPFLKKLGASDTMKVVRALGEFIGADEETVGN